MATKRTLIFEWQTKFGQYRLFTVGDRPETFVRDAYEVKKRAMLGPKVWWKLDLSALDPVDAQSILAGFAAAVAE